MRREAVVSKDKVFRYSLLRVWNEKQPVLVVLMLNPSTADANIDDPTIKKVIWLAAAWHFGGILVVNFCAYRATKPPALFAAAARGEDIIGGQNMQRISNAVLGRVVLCAWGANVRRLDQRHVERVKNSLRRNAHKLVCIDRLEDGTPKHPLYARKDSPMRSFVL